MSMKNNVPEIRFKGFSGEWENLTLGDLGSVAMNKRIFKHQTAITGDVPFFKIGTFGKEPDAFISKALFDEYKAMYPYPVEGDLLLSASGSIGRVVEYKGEDQYFQDSNIVWLKHDGKIDNTFLKVFYSIVKWSGLEGSTIKRLYNKNILDTQISRPEKKEQIAIGNTFQKVDNLIKQHQQKHDKLNNIKKAMLDKMFPKKDETIPEIRFKEFSENWECVHLGEICEFMKGQLLSWKDIDCAGNNPCILYGHLYTTYGMTINKILYYTSNDNLSIPRSRHGDILIPGSDTTPTGIARAACIEINDVLLGGDINILRPNENINGKYLSYCINANRKKLIQLIKGTSVKHLVNSDLVGISLKIPASLEEQTMIGNYFQKLDTLINQYQKQITKLKNIKQACLSKMFV